MELLAQGLKGAAADAIGTCELQRAWQFRSKNRSD
jgi:hypothetical protein